MYQLLSVDQVVCTTDQICSDCDVDLGAGSVEVFRNFFESRVVDGPSHLDNFMRVSRSTYINSALH